MPYLYCPEHGKNKENQAISEVGKYEGEYTKIVTGLLVDNYICDICNKPLKIGDIAYYISFLTEGCYDPRGEENYFSGDSISENVY